MGISAKQVKELRDKTGAGMMDCKKALLEADGDIEKAIEILRKKGASVAAKRAERLANEGMIKTTVMEDGKFGVILEVNCETDFVAKSEDFLSFVDIVLNSIVQNKPASLSDLLSSIIDGEEIEKELTATIGKIGEKIEISRFNIEQDDNITLFDYIHHGSKLGVLVKAEKTNGIDSEKLNELLKDLAMQVAAMRPLYITIKDVPEDAIEKEKEIYKEVAKKEGKPDKILDKIAEGKMKKFYQEVCLLEQFFIKDNSKTVKTIVDEFNDVNSSNLCLTKFYRYHLGDEKK
ncbi:translation elongation factor Ts [Bacteroidota bacterium]